MKLLSIFWAVTVGLAWLAASETACAGENKDIDLLLDAIAKVESQHDVNAVGDSGRAIGAYQIHKLYWRDGTRILGVDWKYEEARDPEKARRIVQAYLCHYGKGKSLLDLARIHNGGPSGYRKRATLRYARKVEAVMEAIEASCTSPVLTL